MDMKADRPTLGLLLRDLRARKVDAEGMSERPGSGVDALEVEHDRLTLTYDKLLQVSEA